jgi:hypothetical protein
MRMSVFDTNSVVCRAYYFLTKVGGLDRLTTDEYVPFRTDEQRRSLVDGRFWKSRLFDGLP